jgi:predicted ester cyclase
MEDMASGYKASGGDEVLGYAQGWKMAFPDMVGTCDRRHVAGDVLLEECTWTGTHTGDMMTPNGTIPPTNKTVKISNILVWEFEGGKVKSAKKLFGYDVNDVSTWSFGLSASP